MWTVPPVSDEIKKVVSCFWKFCFVYLSIFHCLLVFLVSRSRILFLCRLLLLHYLKIAPVRCLCFFSSHSKAKFAVMSRFESLILQFSYSLIQFLRRPLLCCRALLRWLGGSIHHLPLPMHMLVTWRARVSHRLPSTTTTTEGRCSHPEVEDPTAAVTASSRPTDPINRSRVDPRSRSPLLYRLVAVGVCGVFLNLLAPCGVTCLYVRL